MLLTLQGALAKHLTLDCSLVHRNSICYIILREVLYLDMATYLLLVTWLQDWEPFILPIYTTDPHNEVTADKTQIIYPFEYLFLIIYLLAFIYLYL